jgi:hypothetical protein
MRKSIWRTLSEDLRANTGRAGKTHALAALFYHPGFCAMALHRVAVRLDGAGPIGRLLGV